MLWPYPRARDLCSMDVSESESKALDGGSSGGDLLQGSLRESAESSYSNLMISVTKEVCSRCSSFFPFTLIPGVFPR